VNVATSDPVQLCRTLLAYTAPGSAVAVPHAALAALVELVSVGVLADTSGQQTPCPLPELYDVASLSRRYGRAPATVRQWFATGLFGAAKDRLFRGRGYVASAEAVRDFEQRTGIRPGPIGIPSIEIAEPPALTGSSVEQSATTVIGLGASQIQRGDFSGKREHGGKIRAAANAGRRRR
jgi:hypothetical protein